MYSKPSDYNGHNGALLLKLFPIIYEEEIYDDSYVKISFLNFILINYLSAIHKRCPCIIM